MNGERRDAAERYGKHSQANARGLGVAELLRRVVARGDAIRLAWRGREATGVADPVDEFPTAVLPVIRDSIEYQVEPDGPPGDEDETEPTTATREARKWLPPSGFSWWPRLLVG